MKKFYLMVMLGLTIFTGNIYGVEIIPEYFLMERLIMFMDIKQPTYVSNDGMQKLKAMQVDKDVLKLLETSENPFYIYDSNGEKRLVRVGDYFYSPLNLSSIYVLNKADFEANFRDISSPAKELSTNVEEVTENINPQDTDETKTIETLPKE